MPVHPRLRLAAAVVAVVLALTGAAPPAVASSEPPAPAADAWLLIDAGDRARLAAHAPGETRSIASTTKLMTALLALQRLDPDDELTAPRYRPMLGESLMGFKAGETVSVRDLLYGLLLPSGNDAAVALADGVAGSEDAFVGEMNHKAARMGLDDTHYANPIGLDAPGNYSTAADLAALTLRLREDSLFRKIVNTPAKTVTSGSRTLDLENTNQLLDQFEWVNGVKTGHTLEAGNVLVASATMKDVTLVSVLLGAPTEAARNEGSLALLRYGFSQYRTANPVGRDERLGSTALSYRDERLPLIADRGVSFTVRRGQDVETRVVREPAEIDSAEQGEQLGTAVVTLDAAVKARIPLVAAHTVAGPDLGDKLDSALPGSRTDAWLLVIAAVGLAGATLITGGLLAGRAIRSRGERA